MSVQINARKLQKIMAFYEKRAKSGIMPGFGSLIDCAVYTALLEVSRCVEANPAAPKPDDTGDG